jgi:DNA-binding LytR/AlgR family response regulator
MKIRIEIDEELESDEVIIRCQKLSDEVSRVQKAISEVISEKSRIVFYKGDAEYYFPLEKILFFETEEDGISAHTVSDIYKIKYRLYELEEILPGYFLRISKSAILNTRKIFAIDRDLSSTSTVSFQNTHKQVYVSRRYYKPLKDRLEERG